MDNVRGIRAADRAEVAGTRGAQGRTEGAWAISRRGLLLGGGRWGAAAVGTHLLPGLGGAGLLGGLTALGGCAGREAAPVFDYTLLDGKTASSRSLLGKVWLLNFWATSCVSCVEEMPHLVETWQKFQARGYDTLAVAMSYDPPAYVSRFAQSRQLPFGVAIDNTGAIAKAFNDTKITPTSYLIDAQGGIVKRYVGKPEFDSLHLSIDGLLKQAAAAKV